MTAPNDPKPCPFYCWKLLAEKDERINKLEAQLKLFAEEPGDVLDRWEKLVERNHELEEALLKWKSIGNGAQLKVLELERDRVERRRLLKVAANCQIQLYNTVERLEKDLAQAVEALRESNAALGATFSTPSPEMREKRSAIYTRGQELLSRLADVNRNVISNCVISVWKDGSYRVEQHLDSVYGAQNDSDFLVEIPLQGVFVAPARTCAHSFSEDGQCNFCGQLSARTEEDPNVVICRTCKKSYIDCTCFEDREQAQVEGEKP